jgi:putative transcriptional regulator
MRRISRAARRPAGKARGARISGYANDEQRRRTGCPASELCDELLTQDTSGDPSIAEKHDPSLDLAYRIAALSGQPVERIFDNPHV